MCLHLAFSKPRASPARCLCSGVARGPPGWWPAGGHTMPCRCLKRVSCAAGSCLPICLLFPDCICHGSLLPLTGILTCEQGRAKRCGRGLPALRLEMVSRLTEAWRTGCRGCSEEEVVLPFTIRLVHCKKVTVFVPRKPVC